jgi:hypothetical protein
MQCMISPPEHDGIQRQNIIGKDNSDDDGTWVENIIKGHGTAADLQLYSDRQAMSR